jgi:transcriptional regulator with XRE-family HTH domain
MVESAFGAVMRSLRERRELSLRDLGALADIDHAYISKIERGEKEPPPEETFGRLIRHLKLSAHEQAVLKFLYSNANVDPALAIHALSDVNASPEILTIAISVVHRGTVRPTPAELVERAKRAKWIMEGQ